MMLGRIIEIRFRVLTRKIVTAEIPWVTAEKWLDWGWRTWVLLSILDLLLCPQQSLYFTRLVDCLTRAASYFQVSDTHPSFLVMLISDQGWKTMKGTSLVMHWVGIHLPIQGTQIWSLILEDPTCHGQLSPCTTTTDSTLYTLRATTTEPVLQNK